MYAKIKLFSQADVLTGPHAKIHSLPHKSTSSPLLWVRGMGGRPPAYRPFPCRSSGGDGVFGRRPWGRRLEGRVASSAVGRHGGCGSSVGEGSPCGPPLPLPSAPLLLPSLPLEIQCEGGASSVGDHGDDGRSRGWRRRWWGGMGAADPASGVGYDGGGGGSDLLASGSVAGDRGGDGGSWIRARVLVLIFFFFQFFYFSIRVA